VTRDFKIVWQEPARATFDSLETSARKAQQTRSQSGKKKASKQEGLFKQVLKCIDLLENNPRHPGLQTHEFTSIEHPYQKGGKVFEAYVQHKTPGAYRIFWCYGPEEGEITIIAITPHP
jgi:hypothetical protein